MNKDFLRGGPNQRNQHCSNCGKSGHLNRSCKDPITSFGIICLKFNDANQKEIFETLTSNLLNANISMMNTFNNNCMNASHRYADSVKFLLIRRRHSLGMLEFVRGRYDIRDYQGITKLFKLMSRSEIDMIRTNENFRAIWESIWTQHASQSGGKTSSFEDEFEISADKYRVLRTGFREENILGLSYYTNNVAPEWETPEWGFPKGRRTYHEKNMDCALREFGEETGYSSDDHVLVKGIMPLKEVFDGTNNIPYKHVYYISVLQNGEKQPTIEESNREIGDVGWFTYSEAVKLFRPYHTEKKRLLNEVFKYIVSVLETSRHGHIARCTPVGQDVGTQPEISRECVHRRQGQEVLQQGQIHNDHCYPLDLQNEGQLPSRNIW